MRINNQNKLYINNSKTTKQPKTPAFKGLLYIDPKTKMPLDSWFYRDYATLEAANYEIEKTFPNGAEIWDFACANAEETISEKTLLENPKYKLIGYDSSTSAIKLAKKGIYTVFSNWYDSFLLPDSTQDNKELYLKDKFYNIMEEIEPPETERHINNKADYFNIKKFYHSFQEKYFQVKPQRRKEIDIRTGNINRIENYRNNDKIGAVFFRNALYQMTGNDINETIEQRKYFSSGATPDKKRIIEELVNKIHSKLAAGGVFVIGDHIKDHLFLADKNLPNSEIVLFKDTPYFEPENRKHLFASQVKLFKESPLKTALEKAGRFVPVGFSQTSLTYGGIKIKVPTVWKKVK